MPVRRWRPHAPLVSSRAVAWHPPCAVLMFGSAVWAYIIGSICGIISTLNPVLVEYRNQMDEARAAPVASFAHILHLSRPPYTTSPSVYPLVLIGLTPFANGAAPQLNCFIAEQGVPIDLAMRLRRFFRNSRYLIRAKRYDQLRHQMSSSLWGETSYLLARKSLSKVRNHYQKN